MAEEEVQVTGKKLCPLRKRTTTETRDVNKRFAVSIEEFLPCIEDKCEAWSASLGFCEALTIAREIRGRIDGI